MDNTIRQKVSVIVPVYNVEKYLDRCVNSIIRQTYNNIEIILVNDGSTDLSGQMCDEWKVKDARIKVIHKVNAGLGFARNSGLEIITGEFVSFVDSDDYLKDDAYEKLVNRMNETHADVCYFGCNYDNNGEITSGNQIFPSIIFDKKKISEELLPISFGTSIQRNPDQYGVGSVCCALYRSEIFERHGLRFGSERNVLSEDILFTSHLLTKVGTAAFVNENLYYYCYNGTSLSHSYRKDRFEKAKLFYALQLELIKNENLERDCIRRAQYSFLINVIVCLKQELARKDKQYRKSKDAIKEISNDELYRKIYKETEIGKLNIKKQVLFISLYYGMTRVVYFVVKHNK